MHGMNNSQKDKKQRWYNLQLLLCIWLLYTKYTLFILYIMYVYTQSYNLWTSHKNMDAEPRRLLHWKKETRKQISSQRTKRTDIFCWYFLEPIQRWAAEFWMNCKFSQYFLWKPGWYSILIIQLKITENNFGFCQIEPGEGEKCPQTFINCFNFCAHPNLCLYVSKLVL